MSLRLAASLAVAILAFPAAADTLEGRVLSALDESPLAGAEVRVAATGAAARTDSEGRYRLEAPAGTPHVLEVRAADHHPLRLVRQTAGREGRARLVPLAIPSPETLHALDEPRFGVPWHRAEARAVPGGEQRLEAAPEVGRLLYTAPAQLPATLKVARRFASSCSGNPIQRIDEIAFEDYVAGVVPAEIGVFKSTPGGPESARASFETFAILARTYALWWYLNSGGAGAEYHLDDTACNQRYDDARDDWITSVVATTAGQVMVKAIDPTVIDKYEYAASCGRNGTRPEYQTAIVPDVTGVEGCTNGGWCGHNDCAAHEDHPDVPGTDRCLVRGTCQWGSLEWAFAGQTSTWILDHYEPNLIIRDLGGDPTGNVVGFVREGDVYDGPNIAGATVTLDSGESVTTGDNGLYRFDALELGATVTLTASAPGYQTASRERLVELAGDNWASMALLREGASVDGGGSSGDGGAVDPDGGDGGGGDALGGCQCGVGSLAGGAGWVLALLVLGVRRRRS